jgi:hypothetical protein
MFPCPPVRRRSCAGLHPTFASTPLSDGSLDHKFDGDGIAVINISPGSFFPTRNNSVTW